MKYIYRCPICGKKMKVDYSYYDNSIHTTVNDCSTCSKCGYFEESSYGNYRDGVKGVSVLQYCYCYHTTKEECKKHKKKLWSYRKRLLRVHKIKGRYNNL